MFYIHGLLPERFSPSQRIHIWPAHIRNMWVKLKKAVLVSAHFWSPIDFSDLRSHLLIIHTLLFSRQYKSMPTSLPSNKLYWDLTRVRKNRICPNCKRRSANFPKSWQEWTKKKVMEWWGEVNGLYPSTKAPSKSTARWAIDLLDKISWQWHSKNRFQDSFLGLD